MIGGALQRRSVVYRDGLDPFVFTVPVPGGNGAAFAVRRDRFHNLAVE
jgi:hypothetical protein